MREIKFRAWHKHNNKMLDLKALTPLAVNEGMVDGLYIPFSRMLEIMQYTGLKDKNGKEIYEGDIVTGGMVRCQEGFSIRSDKTTVTFTDGMFKAGSLSLISISRACEVIGNIYEHPHLLAVMDI